MKGKAAPALLTVLLTLLLALELLYPSGPEITGESYRPDRSEFEAVRDSFSARTIDYFLHVAFRRERSSRFRIRKWNESLRISTLGTLSNEDSIALTQAVEELIPLIAPLQVTLTDRDPNVEVYFSPATDLPKYEPNYESGSEGNYWCWWSSTGAINRCRIVIATDLLSGAKRRRALRTFLLGALGFMGSRPERGEDSLFDPTSELGGDAFSPLDQDLVRLLYRGEIYPGMSLRTARSVLSAP